MESDVGETVVVFVTDVEAGRVVEASVEVSDMVDGTLSDAVVEVSAALMAGVLAPAEVGLGRAEVDEGSASVRLMFIIPYPSSSRKTDADARPKSTETPKSTRGIICAVTEPLSVVEPPIERCNAMGIRSVSLSVIWSNNKYARVWSFVCDAWPVLGPSS